MSESIVIYNTEEDLHTLLDGLAHGEHVKATWSYDDYTITSEGPVRMCDRSVRCARYIRLDGGAINIALTSLEVARVEEATTTRDDEKALQALVESLEDGDVATAEWNNGDGPISVTGKVRAYGSLREIYEYGNFVLRYDYGILHYFLRSVSVSRPVVYRWVRDGVE